MPYPAQPWRDALLPASFAGAGFHVEAGGKSGGRRLAVHEYPKADTPNTEDMGRKARRWAITGYVIGPDYLDGRDALIAACEAEGPFTLVHPSLGEEQVHCENYSVVESRERGGFAQFDMQLVEAGADPDASTSATADTQAQVTSAADASDATAASTVDNGLSGQTGGGVSGINAGAGSGDYVATPGGPTGGYPSGIAPPSLKTGANGLVVGGV